MEREDKVVHPQVLRVGQESLVVASVLWENCYGTWFTALSGQGIPRFPTLCFWLVVLGAVGNCPSSWLYFWRLIFKLLNMHHLSLRAVYNFKCFLQLASLAGNDLPNKMFLISTPPTWAFWALVS